MKKHLLMCLVALSATVGVNAQGTFKVADYCLKNNLAYTSTVGADGKTVNTTVAFAAGAVISDVPNITFTASGATDWMLTGDYTTNTVNTTYNGIEYGQIGQAQGQSNGKDGYVDGGTTSSVAIFTPAKDGKLDIIFKFGYNKKFYVAELTDAALDEIDLADSAQVHPYAYNNSQYWGGYWNADNGQYYEGTAVDGTSATKSYFTGCTLDVKAGKYYYVWASGSKIMLCGYNYTVTAVEPTTANVTFTVDDSKLKTSTGYGLKGSWITATGAYDTNWDGGAEHSKFFDDGTNGDKVAGDHIWSVTVKLTADAAATWKWGVNNAKGDWLYGDFEFKVTDAADQTLNHENTVGVNDMKSSATIVKTEYYNTLGVKLSQPANGLNIIKKTMSDGSIVTSKRFFNK